MNFSSGVFGIKQYAFLGYVFLEEIILSVFDFLGLWTIGNYI